MIGFYGQQGQFCRPGRVIQGGINCCGFAMPNLLSLNMAFLLFIWAFGVGYTVILGGLSAQNWTRIPRRIRVQFQRRSNLFSAFHSLEWKFLGSVLTPRNFPKRFSKPRRRNKKRVVTIRGTETASKICMTATEIELIQAENRSKKRANFSSTARNSTVSACNLV